jgi:hypothetical protein
MDKNCSCRQDGIRVDPSEPVSDYAFRNQKERGARDRVDEEIGIPKGGVKGGSNGWTGKEESIIHPSQLESVMYVPGINFWYEPCLPRQISC